MTALAAVALERLEERVGEPGDAGHDEEQDAEGDDPAGRAPLPPGPRQGRLVLCQGLRL